MRFIIFSHLKQFFLYDNELQFLRVYKFVKLILTIDKKIINELLKDYIFYN